MLAKRIPTILPKLNEEEAIELTQIYSIAGKTTEENSFITQRPFCQPHHSISTTALMGGGRFPKPGQISLAHGGVLFLDELAEYQSKTLEMLRNPIEDKKITIHRSTTTVTYPCHIMLVASMNPCPCGYYGSEQTCHCTQKQIRQYRSKISGPLLDRIDIQVEVGSVLYEQLKNTIPLETSSQIRKRVEQSRAIQKKRYQTYGFYTNADLPSQYIPQFCQLNRKSEELLEQAFKTLRLSARAYEKILKVSRTIADMEQSDNIKEQHILEAISYRSFDRNRK